MADVIVAVIGALATIVTVLITSASNRRSTDAQLEKAQAVTDTKLDELTREVRLHNNFAQRVPVIEKEIQDITRRIDKLEH